MKFPLPGGTFPSVALSPSDALAFENLAAVLVQELLKQHRDFTVSRSEVVDPSRWRKAARHENVTVYKELRHATSDSKETSDEVSSSLPLVLAVGTLDGDLDDVMYGVINHTEELMRTKAAYLDDRLVDCNVLATIIQPSKTDPLRSLTIKWHVKGRSRTTGPLVRFRDFVYLESTGIVATASGQRIGYHIQHSVVLPGIRELSELNIVRASLSTRALYPERRAGDAGLFVKSFVDPCGDVPASVAVGNAASAVLSSRKNIRCAQMKKLHWFLTNMRATVRLHERESCSVCERNFVWAFSVKKACRICLKKVCSRCCVKKTLNFVSPFEVGILKKDLSFCTRCLYTANQASALEIAVDEVHEEEGDDHMHKRLRHQDDALSNWNLRHSVASPRSDDSVSLLETASYLSDKSNHIIYISETISSSVESPSEIAKMSPITARTLSATVDSRTAKSLSTTTALNRDETPRERARQMSTLGRLQTVSSS